MSIDQYELEAFEDQNEILDKCFARLSNSPNARAMINEIMRDGWRITISDQGDYDFHIDVKDKEIILNNAGFSDGSLRASQYFQNLLMVSLIQALRDVWQEKRHGGFYEYYGPEHVLMLERTRAADCDVMAVLVAWELRSAGAPELWRHMIGSEDGDIAMAFSGCLERAPYSAFSNEALLAAFNQWHRCAARVKACDHETLNYMDLLIEENAQKDVFGNERLSAVDVEVLSCLPDKTAYLQGAGREIMVDPFYAGLEDPINQSHFAQIMYDLKVTYVQSVPFRDKALAAKIFPGGHFTNEKDKT